MRRTPTHRIPRAAERDTRVESCVVLVSWMANNAIPVNRTGTTGTQTTCRPFTSRNVAVCREVSPLEDTDTPRYVGPNTNQSPAAHATAWAVHADSVVMLTFLSIFEGSSAATRRHSFCTVGLRVQGDVDSNDIGSVEHPGSHGITGVRDEVRPVTVVVVISKSVSLYV